MTIAEDPWLAGMLGRPVFSASPDTAAQAIAAHRDATPGAMYMCRVPASATRALHAMSRMGFGVVDCAVTLTRPGADAPADDARVRWAGATDVDRVADIGGTAFRWSRFHLDPEVPDAAADAIKREWARNCAAGRRGVGTLVSADGGTVTGFLAVTAQRSQHTIDLVGVDSAHQGRGWGSALVRAFIARFGPVSETLRVGTQAANTASIRLYESLGFRMESATYVLHLHT